MLLFYSENEKPSKEFNIKKGLEKYRKNVKIAMSAYNIQSVQELSAQSGISATTIKKLMNVTIDPKMRHGKCWKPSVIKLANCMNVDPRNLFPEYSYDGLIMQIAELKGIKSKEILTMPYIAQKRLK